MPYWATDKTDMTSQRGFFGWKLVSLLWVLDFLNVGLPLYGGAVINTYMYKQISMFILGLCCYFLGSFLAIRVSADALWITYSAALLYGLAFGWTFICLNTITGNYYGPAAFPKLSGIVYMIAAIFCSPAGALAGKLFDLYHSYKLAFELNSLVAALGIVALFFARVPTPPSKKALVEPPEIVFAK